MYDDEEEILEEPEEDLNENLDETTGESEELEDYGTNDSYSSTRRNRMTRKPIAGAVPKKMSNETTPEPVNRRNSRVGRPSQNIINNNLQHSTSTKPLNILMPDKENNELKGSATIIKALKNPVVRRIILIAIPVALILLVIIFVAAVLSSENTNGGLAINGYYEIPCDEVTVVFVDENYEPTRTETYPLEEYVAGVVVGEVAYLGSHEVDKAFAIAARTFFAAYAESNGCTIESSDRRQVFNEVKNQSATKAAEETKGQVLLQDGKLYGTIQYDAFACIDEDENYYTISQANQKVPKEWINAKIDKNNPKLTKWFICNGKENLQNHHGNGMSQFGSLYLATEQDYKYDQILKFYLGENVTISSNYITSIAGLDVKTTTRARNTLNEPISEFLSAKGSNLDQYNNFIKGSVESAGFGTRAGVVTAAVSMINFLYDNFDTKLPYYWGGQAQQYGLPTSIGSMQNSATSPGGYTYYYKSFDCSGFVSWAIKNGGYKLSRLTTRGFDSSFSGDSCNIKDSNCIGQPGDLINSKSCHVQMIVSVDEASGKYYVAESTGEGVIMRQWGMHQGNCNFDVTKILHMDSYYNNQNNVDN